MASGSINFALDGNSQNAVLVYRPWSVRTLKVVVSVTAVNQNNFPALRLRTKRMADKDVTGITCGYADDNDDFVISWGGGHENGPCIQASDDGHVEGCIPLEAAATSNIFLNVHHRGPGVPETAVVTLEAYNENENNKVYASLNVTLQKPVVDASNIVQLHAATSGNWQTNAGTLLPTYDPRWHPDSDVTYVSSASIPLQVQQDEFTLRFLWGGEEIAMVEDKTRPSMLDPDFSADKYQPGGVHFELFHWDNEFFALRIWFSWLNIRIPDHIWKAAKHEVPDAERFDLLIRRKTGHIGLACTDLHWREMWGRCEDLDEPVTGYIGLTGGTLIRVGIEDIMNKKLPQNLPDNLVIKKKLPYDLLLEFVKREADAFADQDDNAKDVTLGPGNQAHVPTLNNVVFDPMLVGKDVRYE